jgi:hypothetical protein
MEKYGVRFFINPFERIAGGKALAWGMAGMVISTILSYWSEYHYHGLLHYGPASNSAWWCYAAEHLIIWLVPALLFYLGGLLFSRSQIRPVDVLGTTLFAQIPLLFTGLIALTPFYERLKSIGTSSSLEEQITQANALVVQPGFWVGLWLGIVSFGFVVLMGYWLFKALSVSCNLKGKKLALVFCVGLFGGDILCRLLINYLY